MIAVVTGSEAVATLFIVFGLPLLALAGPFLSRRRRKSPPEVCGFVRWESPPFRDAGSRPVERTER